MSDQFDDLPEHWSRFNEAPIISPETEFKLARAAREGDAQARERLIESSMRLVIAIAKTFNRVRLEDAVSAGAGGLQTAVDHFDPDKGFRFSTYASHWIRQSIGRLLPK